MVEDLTPKDIEEIIDELKAGKIPKPSQGVGGSAVSQVEASPLNHPKDLAFMLNCKTVPEKI